MLSKFLWQQSAPKVDMEPFEGNPLEFTNFMSIYQELVQKKIDDPRGRLIWLIKYIRGDPREMVKNFINDRDDCGHKNAIALFQKQYKSSFHVLIIQEGYQTDATFETWRCSSILETVQFSDQMWDNGNWF